MSDEQKKIEQLEKQLLELKAEFAEFKLQFQHGFHSNIQETVIEDFQAQPGNSQTGTWQENMGALWKRTATGFEEFPYCKECPTNPIMRLIAQGWVCPGNKHIFPHGVHAPAF